jgi:hypothetical protein
VGYLKYKNEFKLILRAPEELKGIHLCDSNYMHNARKQEDQCQEASTPLEDV